MTLTNFPAGITSFGVPVIGGFGGIPLTGTWFFVDPANGSDSFDGLTPSTAFATLYKAHSRMTAGKNDVCVLIGDGSTTGTARLSTANAASVDSSATTGTLTWSKNACHLLGVTAPTGVSNRARIAPPSGTYTQETFGSGNFVTVSASGCIFANFSLFNGFSTGGTNQICWTDSGARNYYGAVHFGGMGDAASAQNTGSRSLKISGGGEHLFEGCTVGLDTVTRSVANASLEFSGGTARSTFRKCTFPIITSSADALFIKTGAAAALDRYQLFEDCAFINAIDSTSTQMTVAASMAASSGGMLVMQRCSLIGATKWGDAAALGQMLVDGGAPTAATTGLAVNPS